MAVVTMLEAHVEPGQWAALEQAYKEAIAQLDPGMTQTLLLHSLSDPTLWRIATTWLSREALDAMRGSGETPRGVLIFRAAGAEPSLSVFDVAAEMAVTS